MSISKQIIFSSSLVALLALFGGYVSYRNMHAMETNVDQCMGNAVDMANSIRGIQGTIIGIHKWFFHPENKEEFEVQMEVFSDYIDQLSFLGKNIDANFRSAHKDYFDLEQKVAEGQDEAFFAALRSITYSCEQTIRMTQEANSLLIMEQSQVLKKNMASLNFWLIIICVSMFFMAGIFGQLIARALSKSLIDLEHSAAEILKGNFSSRVDISANNEFGYLSNSFNMLASSAESAKMIQDQKQELVKLNSELKLKNDSLDSFVYRVSHDLKAPLINLISLQTVVKKKVVDSKDHGLIKSLDFMSKNTDKLQRTINDLLEVSRIERSMKTGIEKVDFHEIINEVLEENGEAIEEGKVTLNFNLEVEELVFSKANVKSIFANLITNSIKYRSPDRDPLIYIETKRKNKTVNILIKDNGIGIDLDKHGHKLFGIFNRFHNHVEGSGVGLYIVKKVVEESGGSITIESEVGVGTSFMMILPLRSEIEMQSEVAVHA